MHYMSIVDVDGEIFIILNIIIFAIFQSKQKLPLHIITFPNNNTKIFGFEIAAVKYLEQISIHNQ